MSKNVYTFGFLIFIATMLVFFGVYFFGYNTNYFNTSMLLNAFLMPALYTLGAYFSVTTYKKEVKEIGFRDAFGRAFKPMFIGGFLSMFSIFAFLNYVDTDAKDLLNHQYVERQKTELDNEYNKAKQILAKKEDKEELDKRLDAAQEELGRLQMQIKEHKLPVLVLTAKDKEYDKVAGLDGGADDYMTKPFSVLELLARVRSLLRRTKEEEPEQPKLFDCGALHLDLETREVKVNGREVLLTYKEYELLKLLMTNAGIVTTRELILDRVWGIDFEGESRTLDMHIKTLRQKLKEEGSLIKTVRNVGYIMNGEKA